MMKCVQKMGNALLLPVCIWKSATPRRSTEKDQILGSAGRHPPQRGQRAGGHRAERAVHGGRVQKLCG